MKEPRLLSAIGVPTAPKEDPHGAESCPGGSKGTGGGHGCMYVCMHVCMYVCKCKCKCKCKCTCMYVYMYVCMDGGFRVVKPYSLRTLTAAVSQGGIDSLPVQFYSSVETHVAP